MKWMFGLSRFAGFSYVNWLNQQFNSLYSSNRVSCKRRGSVQPRTGSPTHPSAACKQNIVVASRTERTPHSHTFIHFHTSLWYVKCSVRLHILSRSTDSDRPAKWQHCVKSMGDNHNGNRSMRLCFAVFWRHMDTWAHHFIIYGRGRVDRMCFGLGDTHINDRPDLSRTRCCPLNEMRLLRVI